jgi:oxygen-independent coproporphyrinogen-3 oxidase
MNGDLPNPEGSFPATPATLERQAIDPITEMKETMLMGLRLTQEGVSRQRFHQRFDRTFEEMFGQDIEDLVDQGLLEWDQPEGDRLRLTVRGRLLGNQVFIRFL